MDFVLARFSDSSDGFVDCMVVDGVPYPLPALALAYGNGGGRKIATDTGELLLDWSTGFEALTALHRHGRQAGWFAGRESKLSLPEPNSRRRLPPIPRPGTIFCAAANYRAHVAEMARSNFTGPASAPGSSPAQARAPYHFLKATSCVTGPDDVIVLPRGDRKIDWEVELGAVIGMPAKHVGIEKALAHVAGFVVVNDVSCRAATWREDRPNIRSDWLAGKSYDTFMPMGPYFVPAAFVPDYRELTLRLWVNGKLQQEGLAGDMIFSLEAQIAYLSDMLTLRPGDVIATGTPAGVGQGKDVFLKPGDLVEAEIGALGRQANPVVASA